MNIGTPNTQSSVELKTMNIGTPNTQSSVELKTMNIGTPNTQSSVEFKTINISKEWKNRTIFIFHRLYLYHYVKTNNKC
jgi:hypothetical protein